MDVSIIIVNYNTPELTTECINSIYKFTTGIEFEVIVVDNASSDNSIGILSNDNRISLIASNINLGFGKANNLGYSKAKGKYILLLNSDTYLLNNAIKIFHDTFEKEQNNVACLGAVLKCNDGKTPNNSYSNFPGLTQTYSFFKSYYLRINKFQQPIINFPAEVDYIIGADLMIRRDVIDTLGLFDPDFFMYFEESEMQLRYARNGYLRKIINGPEIVHLEGGSFKNKSKLIGKKAVMYFQSMNIYMKKRYKGIKRVLWRIISIGYIPLIIRNERGVTKAMPAIKALIS